MILKRKMAAILAVVASCCFCFVFGCNTPSTAVKEYKIAFDYAEGAGVLTDLKVKEGDKIGDLPTPTTVPTGYIFAGWKTAEGLIVVNGTTYSFGKDITLKAAYSPETYSITYDVAGGDPLPADSVIAYSISSEEITLPTPTRICYIFLGWKESETSEPIKTLAASTTGNKTFTAAWKVDSFTVTLENETIVKEIVRKKDADGEDVKDANGNYVYIVVDRKIDFTDWADGTTGAKTISIEIGKTPTIPEIKWDSLSEQARDNDDYLFDGWFYKDKTGKETKLDMSKSFTFENLNVESLLITVYAKVHFHKQWEVNAFTVTLENEIIVKERIREKDADGEDVKDANGNYVYIVVDRKIDFTDWADGTTGAKTISIEIGKTPTIPEIKWDSMSKQARVNDDYLFSGWFYKDKTGKETKLDISKPFTLENSNVESLQITVYAKVHKQWAGPY